MPIKHSHAKGALSYYGGKYHLLSKILPLIPPHTLYTEVFFGGGSVFFAKEPAKIEVINDNNSLIHNFYKVAKQNPMKLKRLLDATLYSEEDYKKAREIYLNPHALEYNNIEKAWAVFVAGNQSYLHGFVTGWKYNRKRNLGTAFNTKKAILAATFKKRLEHVQLFCRDAIRVLQNMDRPTSFHFIDPPYIGANQGPYSGYTHEQFEILLKACEKLSGKFLLTTYPSEILSTYTKKNGWFQIEFDLRNSASKDTKKRKTEVFTMNYIPTKEILQQLNRKG